MIFSAKLDYAIKALIELARNFESRRLVNLNEICDNQNIPSQFLLQIMSRLKNGGIVESIRGVSGGYILTRYPSKISLKDVILAAEPSVLKNTKQAANKKSSSDIVIENICNQGNEKLIEFFENISLEELLSKTIEKNNITYSI
ncbi:MAG: Rrf2 family transcriptional regulator [Spirochaetia bacterium]|nr:Rrf2 family transcriptional regulator [Spirochaetia bacterium]